MKQVFRYNQDGFYIEPVILQEEEEIPSDCTEKQPGDGLHKAQFVNGEWIETLTQEEITAELNSPKPKTQEEQLAELNLQIIDLYETLINGGLI